MVFLIIGMRVVLMFVGLLTRRYIPADVLGTLPYAPSSILIFISGHSILGQMPLSRRGP